MMHIIKRIFVDNMLRKFISFIAAIIIWFVINKSIISPINYTSINTKIIEESR